MTRIQRYSDLTWNHEFWSLLRYFRSLRIVGDKRVAEWMATLRREACLPDRTKKFPIDPPLIELLVNYIQESSALLKKAMEGGRCRISLGLCDFRGPPGAQSSMRIACGSQSISGSFMFKPLRVSSMMRATHRLRYHLRSAGTMNHGAQAVEV